MGMQHLYGDSNQLFLIENSMAPQLGYDHYIACSLHTRLGIKTSSSRSIRIFVQIGFNVVTNSFITRHLMLRRIENLLLGSIDQRIPTQ